MKTLFTLYYILFSLFLTTPALAAKTAADRAEDAIKNLLIDKNPGAENGKQGWTASGGTFTTVTSGGNFMGIGKANFTWDSGSAAQTLTSPSYTIPAGYAGTNGVLYCKIYAASGTPTHTIGAWNGTTLSSTNTMPAVLSSAKYVYSIPFVFGAATTTIAIRFTSVAADEPLISIDDCIITSADGTVLSQVSQSYAFGTVNYAVSANCGVGGWTVSNTSFTSFAADNDCAAPTLVGNAVAPATKLPAIRFSSMPPGDYHFVATGDFYAERTSQSSDAYWRFTDGTNVTADTRQGVTYTGTSNTLATSTGVVSGRLRYTTVQGDTTIQMQTKQTGGSASIMGSNAPFEITVYYSPLSSQVVLDSASVIDPIGTVITTSDDACPANTLDADGTAVSRTTYAKLYAKIGTTHGTGDGSTTFNKPDYRGRFLRGVAGGQSTDPDRASRTAMNTGGNTGDNVGSVQADAFQTHTHNFTARGTNGGGGNTGIETTTGLGMIASGSRNTPSIASAYSVDSPATGTTSTETRPENAYVKYCIVYDGQINAPLIVNSVANTSSGSTQIEAANINCDSGSAINSQHGSWVSSVGNISGGACAVTLTTGVFTSTPYCWMEIYGAISTGLETSVTETSATAISVDCEDDASTACTAYDAKLFCMGAR